MDINWYMRQKLVNEHQRELLDSAQRHRQVSQLPRGSGWFSRLGYRIDRRKVRNAGPRHVVATRTSIH
jgi:hypothetical protein